MLYFEFCLHTGDSPPVYCRQLVYGTYEKKRMNTHIKVLEDNDWMCDYVGPWCSLLLLVAKPYQEECKYIKAFIWRLCVRYRPLNSVTRGFELPIPHCTDSIEGFDDSSGLIYFISVDARSRYHQVRVRIND